MEEDFTGYCETLIEDNEQYIKYYQEAKWCLDYGHQLLTQDYWADRGAWKLVKHSDETGDTVHSKKEPDIGRVYCLQANIQCLNKFTLEDVFQELYHNFAEGPSWNPDLKENYKVLDIGLQTDITYGATNDILGGVIKIRDFVDVRTWRKHNDSYIICLRSVEVPSKPPIKGRIRAQNILRVIHLTYSTEQPNVIAYHQLTRMDLKGKVPKPMIEKASQHVLLNHAKLLRKRMDAVSTTGS